MAGFALVISPLMAEAGVFSFVTSLFSEETAEAAEPVDSVRTMEILQAATSLNPSAPLGGADVSIVDGVALAAEAGPANAGGDDLDGHNSHGQISMYVVREGDSLSEIAKMFGVSVNTILWTNNLSGKSVKPGQVLVILPISGVRHTVKKGDTIESIAKKYKGDADEIRQYNDISDDKLAVGTVVIVPDGEMTAEAPKRSSGTRIGVSTGVGAPSYSGYYMRPMKGGVRTQGIHGFNGVDIGAPVGTTIYAAAPGEVIISRAGGWNGGYGTYVVIAHDNGTQTLYAHNSSNIVSVGQRVVQGQVIGYSGNTGKSTGPHLHFEVRGAKNPF